MTHPNQKYKKTKHNERLSHEDKRLIMWERVINLSYFCCVLILIRLALRDMGSYWNLDPEWLLSRTLSYLPCPPLVFCFPPCNSTSSTFFLSCRKSNGDHYVGNLVLKKLRQKKTIRFIGASFHKGVCKVN